MGFVAAALVAMSIGAVTAYAAVTWPSSATTWSGVNSHLNALHNTDLTQLSQVKIVSAVLTDQTGGNSLEGSVRCPGGSGTTTGWYATGGGMNYPQTSGDGNWVLNTSGPITQMGPNMPPNGWQISVSDPTYQIGDPIPTDISVYVVCAT